MGMSVVPVVEVHMKGCIGSKSAIKVEVCIRHVGNKPDSSLFLGFILTLVLPKTDDIFDDNVHFQ